jgi:hypothetical protein
MAIEQEDWTNAGQAAHNLSELELTLGDVKAAIRGAEAAVSLTPIAAATDFSA